MGYSEEEGLEMRLSSLPSLPFLLFLSSSCSLLCNVLENNSILTFVCVSIRITDTDYLDDGTITDLVDLKGSSDVVDSRENENGRTDERWGAVMGYL